MATVKINLSLEDAGKSVKARTDEVKGLNRELEKSQRLSTGTKSGNSAVRASYRAAQEQMDNVEYNRARGSMGGTGASGRDFAKQAQGLDGLVRLYAVYAANLFAVSAGFTALSNAMDTTNMVKGLNQLGAASGVALGSLAKQFTEASGGAISLRESMEATAKAVSSGMSQAQFLKLGDVAKKASQALGINMSDAVSRLTRGIVKLEPELLDELGIFTKVGKATEDYARNIGKPVAALTDFERRQAFANAVLDEGAKKFGQIEIDTNPYSKLLATLKDVAQAGLEIINVVIAPFAKLLSSNTTVLVGALALIGTKLVSDALPALANWRTGIKDAAQEANRSSSAILESFGEKFVERTNNAFKVPQLQRDLKNAESEYAKSRTKFLEIDQAYSDKRKKGKFYSTVASSGELTPTGIQREINRLTKDGTDASKQAAEVLRQQKAELVQILTLRKQLTEAENQAQAQADKPLVGEYLRKRVSQGAAGRSERLDILSRVSENSTEGGFVDAFSKLRNEVAGSKTMGAFNKFRTIVTGTMIAATNAVGLFISAFSGIFTAVGLVSAAFSFIIPMFRKNEEAAERFSSSVDALKDSNENAYRVMERLSKLDPLEQLSIPSLQAKATALEGLGGSLVKAIDDFEKEVQTRNWADSTVNFIAGVFGKNSEEKLAAQLTKSVENAVKLAGSSEQASAIKQQLATIVSLPADSSLASISAAVEKASPIIQKQVAQLIETVGKQALRGTGSFTAFNESLVQSGRIYQELLMSFRSSDAIVRFAENSTKQLIELSKVLETGTITQQLRLMSDLTQNMSFLQLLPVDAAKEVLSLSSGLEQLNKDYADSEQAIGSLNVALEYYNNLLAEEQRKGATVDFGAQAKNLASAIRQLNLALGEQRNRQAGISGALEEAAKKFNAAMGTALIANIHTFTRGLQTAAAKASVELRKTYLEGISDPELKAKLDTQLEKENISIDRKQLAAQLKLIESNGELRMAMMEATLATKIATATRPGETAEQTLARPENRALQEEQTAINVARATSKLTVNQLEAALKGGGNQGVMQGLNESLTTAKARADLAAQLKQLEGRGASIDLKGQFAQIDARSQKRALSIDQAIADIQSERARLNLDRKSLSDEEFAAREGALAVRQAEFEATKMLLGPETALAKARIAAKGLGTEDAKRALSFAEQQLANITDQANKAQDLAEQTASRNVNIASGLRLFDQERKITADRADKELQTLNTSIELNGAEQALLQTKQALGMITEQEFKTQSDILAKTNLQLTSARDLLQVRNSAAEKLAEINRKELEAGGPGNVGPQTAAQLAADRAKVTSDLALQEQSIRAVTAARSADIELIAAQTKRQTAYTDLFNNAFKSMEDAIVQFTKTGKLSFSSMIESFLEGLLRYELQQQQIMLTQSVGGARGIAGMFMNALGIGGMSRIDRDISTLISSGRGLEMAKGGAFDYGIPAFAKGGAFTNQIVDSPTLFKFARGTGLMGEAGPEAIMPLKRDSNGNLGVRAQGGSSNVEVVVNNYSNAQAETRETTDSRGNRRIEVIVGDMVAQEVAKTGSATQNAFSSTYGTRPALARR
jgi:lambda family phage tail tape measure protein